MKNGAISANSLTKNYGEFCAVNNVSLEIPKGICFGLLGPNGAGKTTMIQMIQASSPITNGKLEVLGMDTISDSREIRKKIGVIPQEDNLDPDCSVRYNLLVYARYFGIGLDEAKEKAEELLKKVELIDKADEDINNLSGGMKRRLQIARALAHDPDILILDEPTAGVDVALRHDLWNFLQELHKEGKTILLTTHYIDEAELLCERVGIINSGKLVAEDTVSNLKELTKKSKLEDVFLELTGRELND